MVDEKLFKEFVEVINELREKCPWDKAQTIHSLRHLTIEELYELIDGIDKNNYELIKEELGDLLMHIIFYSKIANEESKFDINDVIRGAINKLKIRHPHVFGNIIVNDKEEVKRNWEKIKAKEKQDYLLDSLPRNMPSLIRALRIQEKVKSVGFDWERKEDVWNKVKEELNELIEVINKGDNNLYKEEIIEEFGDLLFVIVNAARLYDVDPEYALQMTNDKFIKRFNYLEKKTKELGKKLEEMNLKEMDEIWEEAKKKCDL